ncbi:MAG: PQQ-like beta-propeller repeat protein [Planctomycetes bacterium]|nr:PQQ-like beta-propeller repeat protein [Planctomycetota bacterium]
MRILSGVLPALVLVGGAVRADDWPQWRGAKRDGAWAETGILEAFPAAGLEVRWRAPLGVGFSTPVIGGGRVFVTDSLLNKPAARERVHAFDEATGKPLWTLAYDVTYPDWAFDEPNRKGPHATPVLRDGKLYTLGGVGHLHCFEAASGAVVWKRDLQKDYPDVELRCTPCPFVEGDLLLLCIGAKPGAAVIALDRGSGKEVWKAIDETGTFSSPVCISAGGVRQFIVWTAESLTSLDPATGKVHWREDLITGADSAIATPVVQGDLLLVSGLMLRLSADKPGVTVLWPEKRATQKRILSNTSTGLILGDHVYSARSSGELVCLELKTGAQVWSSKLVTDQKQGACIHLTPNGASVLIYTERGELIRARLTPEGYQEIGRAPILAGTYPFAGRRCVWSPASFANRCLFARNDAELVFVSLAAKP